MIKGKSNLKFIPYLLLSSGDLLGTQEKVLYEDKGNYIKPLPNSPDTQG